MKRCALIALCCLLSALWTAERAWGQIADEYELGEVVVSANKIPTEAGKVAAAVSVITEEDLSERRHQTLGEALKGVPGGYSYDQGAGQLTTIGIRGGRPVDTQLRYDDFPLRDNAAIKQDFSSFNHALLLHPGALSRVEVLRGAQSTLYGSAAAAGVINMFSGSRWNSDPRFSLRLTGGNYGTQSHGAQLAYGSERSYLNVTPFYHHTDGYRKIWFEETGFNLGWGYRFNENTSLELSSLGVASDAQGIQNSTHNGGGHVPQEPLARDNHDEARLILTGLTLNHSFSDLWQTRLKASYTTTNRDSYRPAYSYETKHSAYSYYAEWLNTVQPLPQWTLLAGLDYERSGMGIDSISVYDPDYSITKSRGAWAVFAKSIVSLWDDKLTLSAGGRYNRHAQFGGHATFDLGAAYNFDFGLKLYANAASAYRAPSLYENYGVVPDYGPLPYIKLIGNPNLKPEKSVHYEFGLEQSLWDKRVIAGGALFRTEYRDLIDAMPWSFSTGFQPYENLDKGRTRGLELYLNLFPHEILRLDLAYAYIDAESMRQGGDWQRRFNIPRNALSATATLYPLDGLSLALTGRWQDSSRISAQGGQRESGFFTLDASAVYDVNSHLSLYAKADNVLDKKYWHAGERMIGFHYSAGLQVTF